MVKRIHAIINPAAGQPKPVLHTINAVCRTAGVDWDASITKDSSDAYRFAQEVAAEGVDVVAVFGGDGTVMEVASALMGSQVPVAILPGGTANVMSVELGIPGDLERACQIACSESGAIRTVDMGRVGEQYFMLRVGIGFAAEHVIGATREMKDRYGVLAYTISALQTMKDLPVARYRLTLDGQQVEAEGITCRVDNSGNVGIPGLSMATDISVSDGLLDVTIIRNADRDSLYSIVASAAGHGTSNPEAFHHWQAREITIEAAPPQRVVGDGEPWGETPITINVVPRSVRFRVAASEDNPQSGSERS